MKQITKNFNEKEFACRCCGKVQYDYILVEKLQVIRELMGEPIIVNSGYRCLKHNKAVGGYSKSNHLKGWAADISCSKENLPHLKQIASKVFWNYGVGLYPSFVHVDIGPYLRFSGK